MEIKSPFTPEIAERFDSLYQLLSRKYQVEQTDINIGERCFRIIAVKNIDDLLDRLSQANPDSVEVKDERLPYWGEIWPSSLALSRFILETAVLQKNTKTLELGCGIGLVGMTAALCGADVLLTDYQPDALRFAEMNWLVNLGESPKVKVLDWRNLEISEQFDFILASDVVYEKRFFYN